MDKKDMKNLKNQLKRHEGLRLKPYKCSAGKLTIGYGRNLDDRGICNNEADAMLAADARSAVLDCRKLFPTFDALSAGRQIALADMMYNLGRTKLARFVKMRRALGRGNFGETARQMNDSAWYSQVGRRAETLCCMMIEG